MLTGARCAPRGLPQESASSGCSWIVVANENSRYDQDRRKLRSATGTGVNCMLRYLISNLLGLVGAALGGVAGFYLYRWILSKGLVGGMIPGAFLGLGMQPARAASVHRPGCGLRHRGARARFLHRLVYERSRRKTFWEYLLDLKSMNQVILLMIALGTVIAFWLGKDAGLAGSVQAQRRPAAPEPDLHS